MISLDKCKKEKKKFLKKLFKQIVFLVAFQLLMVCLLMSFRISYAPVTNENSILVTGKPKDISVIKMSHVTNLYFTIDSTKCRVSAIQRGNALPVEDWIDQFKQEESVTAIVTPHKRFFSTLRGVGVYSDSTLYYDVNYYNLWLQKQRPIGYTLIVIAWIIGSFILSFWIFMDVVVEYGPIKPRKKKDT